MFYCEQLRSLKYEEVCLDEYEKMSECRWAIDSYFRLFNQDIIKTSPVGLREMQEESDRCEHSSHPLLLTLYFISLTKKRL